MPILLSEDETLDDLLHGELKLIQPRRGVRYSVDALLLAHFALPVVLGKRVVDLGTGSGVVALILAARGKVARMMGVELQDSLFRLAHRNAELNKTNPAVEVIQADVMGISERLGPGSFDVAVTNPPYRPVESGQVSPSREKALARHELAMTLAGWLSEAVRLVGPEGRICAVYPVDEENRFWKTCAVLGLHPARRQYALDRPGGRAVLLLADLQLSLVPLTELPPLPIITPAGRFSLDGWC